MACPTSMTSTMNKFRAGKNIEMIIGDMQNSKKGRQQAYLPAPVSMINPLVFGIDEVESVFEDLTETYINASDDYCYHPKINRPDLYGFYRNQEPSLSSGHKTYDEIASRIRRLD